MSSLQISDARAGYGHLEALHGVSLSVGSGEKVAILGPNGAGKSTLLRTISGLLRPTAGSITFDGRSIAAMEPYRIPRLGLVHVPEARHIFGALTVRENLLVGGTVLPNRRARDETLDQVWSIFPALREKENVPAGSLSGGQQQMLAVGRAVMAHPRMILLDEPSLGLAPLIVRDLFDRLGRLAETGVSILLVEQDVSLTLNFVDRAYVLENGTIALEGTARELMGNDHIRRAYLGI